MGGSQVAVGGMSFAQPASFWSCSTAIVKMLAGNMIAASKILKITKYMNALGGVKEAIQLVWGASFNFEKLQVLGGALGGLAAELAGVAGIQKACP